ncbi:MAG: hypothetical protein Q9227_002210 [Pyrenula ochraceoflavens]
MEGFVNFFSQHPGVVPPTDFNDANDGVDVIEIWSTKDEIPNRVVSSRIPSRDLSAWLQNSCSPCEGLLVRLITVRLITTRNPYRLDVGSEVIDQALKAFRLERCYKFAHSTAMTFDVVTEGGYSLDSYSVEYLSLFVAHFFGLYVVVDPNVGFTRGLIWTASRQMDLFHDALINLRPLASHAQYALVAAGAPFNAYHNFRLGQVSMEVSNVEKRTGYQGWDMIAYPGAKGSISELSAKMSGLATSLAANKRLNKMVDEILAQSSNKKLVLHGDENPVCALFEDCRKMLERRSVIQHVHIDFLILLNLSNREEMKLSLELAKDSRTVATASQRDSSSMKALAAVTILFLPGTSISSLFSMSMFDWSDRDRVLSDRFWIYWAVTVPLTVLTVGLWLIWDHRSTILAQVRNREAIKSLAGARE